MKAGLLTNPWQSGLHQIHTNSSCPQDTDVMELHRQEMEKAAHEARDRYTSDHPDAGGTTLKHDPLQHLGKHSNKFSYLMGALKTRLNLELMCHDPLHHIGIYCWTQGQNQKLLHQDRVKRGHNKQTTSFNFLKVLINLFNLSIFLNVFLIVAPARGRRGGGNGHGLLNQPLPVMPRPPLDPGLNVFGMPRVEYSSDSSSSEESSEDYDY